MVKKRRYVVVVHGMGEQVPGATLQSVINQFALNSLEETINLPAMPLARIASCAHRFRPRNGGAKAAITEKNVGFSGLHPNSRDSRRWIAFDSSDGFESDFIWDETTVSNEFRETRFIEVCWSDITERHWDISGEPLERWAASAIDHYRSREGASETDWIPARLSDLRAILGPIRRVMALRNSGLEDLVFGRYLGDVQLYLDNPRCRVEAIHRFLETMSWVHESAALEGEREPEYYFVSHSLGTALSLDGLFLPLFAQSESVSRANPLVSELRQLCSSSGMRLPESFGWLESARGWVTLGSPLDKFITLWPQNYEYLQLEAVWEDGNLPAARPRSLWHLNFCEELDPAAHKLDCLRSLKAYKRLVSPVFCRDSFSGRRRKVEVYLRSPWPGYAHISYWEDSELFRLIWRRFCGLSEASDQDPEIRWRPPETQRFVFRITFLFLPASLALTSLGLIMLAVEAGSARVAIAILLTSLLTIRIMRQFLDVYLWWQRILSKRGPYGWAKSTLTWIWLLYGAMVVGALSLALSYLAGRHSYGYWTTVAMFGIVAGDFFLHRLLVPTHHILRKLGFLKNKPWSDGRYRKILTLRQALSTRLWPSLLFSILVVSTSLMSYRYRYLIGENWNAILLEVTASIAQRVELVSAVFFIVTISFSVIVLLGRFGEGMGISGRRSETSGFTFPRYLLNTLRGLAATVYAYLWFFTYGLIDVAMILFRPLREFFAVPRGENFEKILSARSEVIARVSGALALGLWIGLYGSSPLLEWITSRGLSSGIVFRIWLSVFSVTLWFAYLDASYIRIRLEHLRESRKHSNSRESDRQYRVSRIG